MKEILNYLISHKTLTEENAKMVLTNMAKGVYNDSEVAAFLAIYMMRPVTVEEMQGFRNALLELCVYVPLDEFNPIDMCGTGGDGKDTFNISTLASFVAAGTGVKVAKHGNYGVSSSCGSSNVMEYLGVKFSSNVDVLKRQIDQAGICFLHAPLFHPALKNVAPIRKALGLKTFFNMLGPMVNPAKVDKQVVGVFNLELARIYHYLYQKMDKKYIILHALDGYDEISLTGEAKALSNEGETMLAPKDFGIDYLAATDIVGGKDIASSAKIFVDVLKGAGTEAQNNVVCANAALSIKCNYPKVSYQDAFLLAKDSLESKKAFQTFEKLIALQ